MEDPSSSGNLKNKKVKKQTGKTPMWVWPVKVLILAFFLSLFFSATSELLLSDAGIVIAVVVILIFIIIAIITDMIGVAVTACNAQPFRAMASKKVRGAKECLRLLKNADKVSSLCCDVIGDICGTLSGAAGASILGKIVFGANSDALQIIVASLVSATIASLTIFGKALGKKFAINKCNSIMLKVGKLISVFTPKTKEKKKSKQTEDEEVKDDLNE